MKTFKQDPHLGTAKAPNKGFYKAPDLGLKLGHEFGKQQIKPEVRLQY